MKKTVVMDFDGVINSYSSGWCGMDKIPDPPVPGIREAIEHIREKYLVVVFSTRCATEKGRNAIIQYLRDNNITVDGVAREKPPAVCYVDDRAVRFDGDPVKMAAEVMEFKNWIAKREG